MDELDRAIQYFGSVTALARALGVRWASTVTNWRIRGRVPPERGAEIELLSNGKFSRRKLCPDFDWGDAPLRTIRSAPQKRAA